MKNDIYTFSIFNLSSQWLAAIILCLFLFLSTSMDAQEPEFDDPIPDPFGLYAPTSGDTLSHVRLVDIDHDGVMEAFIHMGTNDPPDYSWRGLRYFENTGTNIAPQFEFVENFPFGIPNDTSNWLWQFADINGDGLEDFVSFCFVHNNPVSIIFNSGSSAVPDFSGPFVYNPFGITLPISDIDGSVWDGVAPTFVDIDADGDLDLFYGGLFINNHSDEAFYFSENTGSATDPVYATPVPNPFGLTFPTSISLHWERFGDVDCDGDLDMYYLGGPPLTFYYSENQGTDTLADFSPSWPPKLTPRAAMTGSFIDIGGDGDLDLISGVEGPGIVYFEHLGCESSVQKNGLNASVALSPNPVQDKLQLTIRSEVNIGNVRLGIFDPQGKLVFASQSETIGNELVETLNVSQLPPGIYFLKIGLEEKTMVQKFVKSN